MSFYEVCLFVCVGVCVWEEYVCIVFLYLVSGSVFRLRSEQDAINRRTHTHKYSKTCTCKAVHYGAGGKSQQQKENSHPLGRRRTQDRKSTGRRTGHDCTFISPASLNFSPSFSFKGLASDPAKARLLSVFLVFFIRFY